MTWLQDDLTDLARQTFWGTPVTIEHLHGSLKGNVHYPSDFSSDRKWPAVLMLHGLGGTRDEHNGIFIRTGASLALAGIIALRIDFRGAGETGGSTEDLTIETEIQDASDALDHLKELPFVDPRNLGVLGLSFGGLTAACMASRREDVKALVMWEAVYDMIATAKRLWGAANVKQVRARGHLQAGMLRLGPRFFDDLEALNVGATIHHFSRPVLIVQGVEDTVVPVDTAFEWKRNFLGTETEVHLIQNADHGFTHEDWAWDAVETSVKWLQANLGQSKH